mmetsp:Transcript_100664/g.324792  ORF Transcript_100664/g.324792 Transcript_100664/m.324792 type:complete len:89 (-) Transcript_100664:166-432(-)
MLGLEDLAQLAGCNVSLCGIVWCSTLAGSPGSYSNPQDQSCSQVQGFSHAQSSLVLPEGAAGQTATSGIGRLQAASVALLQRKLDHAE